MILYSTVNVTFLDNLGPRQIQRRFLQSSIHCFNVLFLERCYTPTKHIFKTKRAQNFGASSLFKPTPPVFLTKSGSQTNLLNLPSTLGRHRWRKSTVQLQETKMAVAPLVAPVASETQQNSERFLRELFGGWQRFWGGGLGVLSSWRCQLKKQPQWVKILRWDFQVGIFLDPLLFLGESTPLLLWLLCS